MNTDLDPLQDRNSFDACLMLPDHPKNVFQKTPTPRRKRSPHRGVLASAHNALALSDTATRFCPENEVKQSYRQLPQANQYLDKSVDFQIERQ